MEKSDREEPRSAEEKSLPYEAPTAEFVADGFEIINLACHPSCPCPE